MQRLDSMATVQILMAVYNGEPYLAEQLDSIIAQKFSDWELLVSDDNSSDGSLAVVQDYCKQDSRIRIVLQDGHYGSAKSHFMALTKEADAPYVMYADQDDVWDQDKISLTLKELKASEKQGGVNPPLLVCTDLRLVDNNLKPLSPSLLEYSNMDASKLDFGYFLASCLVTGCTMMINRSLLLLLQKDCNEDHIMMHDWWASLVASAFGKVIYLNTQTISYRQHGDNSVGAVKFSLDTAIKSLKQRADVENAAITQVEELVNVYGDKLNPQRRRQAEALISARGKGPLGKFTALTKADAWRKGFMRNAATYLSFLMIAGEMANQAD